MYELDQELASSFMASKIEYDSWSQAVKLTKSCEIDVKTSQHMIATKQALKQSYLAMVTKVLKKIPNDTSVCKIDGNWFGIRYLGADREINLRVDIFNEKDVYMLERDPQRRELQRVELETITPGITDNVGLEIYKQKLIKKAKDIIKEVSGVAMPDDGSIDITRVSIHAGKRWVQRKLGIIDDNKAEGYRKTHWAELEAAILKDFKDAELVWSDGEGDEYLFDNNNIMYVYNNHVIITLYEEEFGFDKEINRSIVYQQIKVLDNACRESEDVDNNYREFLGKYNREVEDANAQISLLEAQINVLIAKINTLDSIKDENNKVIRASRAKYELAFNKLFKKWEN